MCNLRYSTLTLAVASLGAANCCSEDGTLPGKVWTFLESADGFELYSLDPKRKDKKKENRFRGWVVLGKISVDREVRKQLLGLLKQAVPSKSGSKCFTPRHGIRALSKDRGSTVDLVISFECHKIDVYVNGVSSPSVSVEQFPRELFNSVLHDAKVKLPTPAIDTVPPG
jgi:hypothetical protein